MSGVEGRGRRGGAGVVEERGRDVREVKNEMGGVLEGRRGGSDL